MSADAMSRIADQVFVLRGGDGEQEWRVMFAGLVEPAAFNSRGAALAYLGLLRSGYRMPESRQAPRTESRRAMHGRRGDLGRAATISNATRLRLSLAALAEVARDLRRSGMQGGGAWHGVLRQVRRYADELRWVTRGPVAAGRRPS